MPSQKQGHRPQLPKPRALCRFAGGALACSCRPCASNGRFRGTFDPRFFTAAGVCLNCFQPFFSTLPKVVHMPQVFAYLRVSTDAQDVANQRHGVTRYCTDKKLLAPVFVEDTASGKTDWRTRPLGQIIDRSQPGDVVVVSEVSRLARNTLQVLEIGRACIAKGVHLHVAKNGIVFDDSMQSKIVATVLGLVAEIERDFISSRTKEALAKRKADGVKLGRPEGKAKTLRLDKYATQIDDYLKRGIQKRSIAKLLDVTPSTLYAWLHTRRTDLNIKSNKTPPPGVDQSTQQLPGMSE